MLKLFKSTEITFQRYKLLLFYILNLLDILFTQFLIFTMPDLFTEVNPFLEPIITSHLGLLFKVLVPIFLIIYWNKRYLAANYNQKKRANILLNLIILVYIGINLLHAFNMLLYILII